MLFRIICPFRIETSHVIEKPGFLGTNKIEIEVPYKIDKPLGLQKTSIEIEELDKSRNFYKFIIKSEDLDNVEKQLGFIDILAKIISAYFNFTESNPHYGNNFIKIEWSDFYVEKESNTQDQICSKISLRDKCFLDSKRNCSLKEIVWSFCLDDLKEKFLTFYYLGLKAESETSKYFYWFLILETLEYTTDYQNMPTSPLFDTSEREEIEQLIQRMNDDRKKSVIRNILRSTLETRYEKLYNFIKNKLKINEYWTFGEIKRENKELSKEVVKKIIETRHKIFHRGRHEKIFNILWGDLFPLVTKIVERYLSTPDTVK